MFVSISFYLFSLSWIIGWWLLSHVETCQFLNSPASWSQIKHDQKKKSQAEKQNGLSEFSGRLSENKYYDYKRISLSRAVAHA